MKVKITFKKYFFDHTGRNRDVTFLLFEYDIIDCKYIGMPEEQSKIQHNRIKVGISRELEISWIGHGIERNQLYKIMFEYAKRYVIQKIKDGLLKEYEILELLTINVPILCEFDPSNIQEPEGYSEVINIPDIKLIDTITKVDKNLDGNNSNMNNKQIIAQIADEIIDFREYINAIYKLKHGNNLLYLSQERNLKDLYRDATNHNEFVAMVASIANLSQCLNKDSLSKVLNSKNPINGSINILEEFLKNSKVDCKGITDIMRNINRLRNQYPIHGDNLKDVLKSYKFFDLEYPILNYSEACIKIKNEYLKSLKNLFYKLRELYRV